MAFVIVWWGIVEGRHCMVDTLTQCLPWSTACIWSPSTNHSSPPLLLHSSLHIPPLSFPLTPLPVIPEHRTPPSHTASPNRTRRANSLLDAHYTRPYEPTFPASQHSIRHRPRNAPLTRYTSTPSPLPSPTLCLPTCQPFTLSHSTLPPASSHLPLCAAPSVAALALRLQASTVTFSKGFKMSLGVTTRCVLCFSRARLGHGWRIALPPVRRTAPPYS